MDSYGHILGFIDQTGDNTVTMTKNTETLIDASKDVGLEIYIEKT
jgi:hypothetical protein